MSKSKKIFFSILISIVVLCFAASWVVGKIITANISKAAITQKLETVTGYHVVINGELHWHYSLRPSLTIDKITLTSKTNEIISLKNAYISMAILPLIQKQFSVDFKFQEWQQNQLVFTKGKAHIDFQNNVLTLTKFQSQFYQGNIDGDARVDLTNATPQFNITLNATQVEIANLLADIAQSKSVSGKMNAAMNLISQGENAEQFIKNLQGKISLDVDNGKLNTINFGSVIPNLPMQGADFFDHLQINAPIENGIANTTVTLSAKNYRANGNGKINFNNQSLNLKLDAYYTRSQQTENIAIPIYIAGQIAAPSVSVDLGQPLGQFLNSNGIKIKNRLNIMLNKL